MMLSAVCGVHSTPWWAWLILGPAFLLAVCALVGGMMS
jgi:hypothetical protein